MGDTPPPLPPKLRISSIKYSVEDQARALQEEEITFQKWNKEKLERSQSQRTVRVQKVNKPHSTSRPHTPVDQQCPHMLSLSRNNNNIGAGSSIADTKSNTSVKKTERDLISFVSPEKTCNPLHKGILEKFNDVNLNCNALVPSNALGSNVRHRVVASPSLSIGDPSFRHWGQTSAYSNEMRSTSFNTPIAYERNQSVESQAPPLPSRNANFKDPLPTMQTLVNNALCNVKKSSSNTTIPKLKSRRTLNKSLDLIDFEHEQTDKTSVIDAFDPLKNDHSHDVVTISSDAKELLEYKQEQNREDDSQSYYEQADPFLYMQASVASTRSDPIADIYDGLYSPGATCDEGFDIPPPVPPRISKAPISPPKRTLRKLKKKLKADYRITKEKLIKLKKINSLTADDEATAFWNGIKRLRREYVHTDHIGNPGLLHSPCLDGTVDKSLSVKLAVYFGLPDPVHFTCTLSATVEHVIMQALVAYQFEADSSDYLLKVQGIDEYCCEETQLGEYDYVHMCLKHDKDVCFTLVHHEKAKRSYLRTAEDDVAIENVDICQLLSVGPKDAIHYDSLSIAVDAFENELRKLEKAGFELLAGTPVHELSSQMRSYPTRHVVKQICALLGEMETIEICKAIENLIRTCRTIQQSQGVLDGEDDGRSRMLCTGSEDSSVPVDKLKGLLVQSLGQMEVALSNLLLMYTRAFRVDYTLEIEEHATDVREVCEIFEKVKVEICGLHRLNKEWTFDEYFVEVNLSMCINNCAHTESKKCLEEYKLYPKVDFSEWLDLGLRVNALPRESRYNFTVFGVHILPAESKSEPPKYIREKLGWTSIQAFSYDGMLNQGSFLLTLWPITSQSYLGPAPWSNDHPLAHVCPILSIELIELGKEVIFPPVEPMGPKLLQFETLDVNTQQQLSDIIERDIFSFTRSSLEEREILWEKRHYLHHEPNALAKVLLASQTWDFASLPDLHSIVLHWTPLAPAQALHLLLPIFPDTVVRNQAVNWIRGLGSDEMIVYLPQLVQAVKHEAWDVSKLTELLLERALTSPRLAHHLYWLLNQCMPRQTNMGIERDGMVDARYRRRLNLVTRALMAICGKNMETRLLRQEALLRTLYSSAMSIKGVKDSQRIHRLHHELRDINRNLQDGPTSLPLSPSLEVAGVDIGACSYYTSFTLPLRLSFTSSEEHATPIHTIFKVGDDLRQDMLVIQMIRLMDNLWLKEGLDLKIVTFNVVPTGDKIGIIELVRDAETLRKIQTENSVAGSFQERPIAEWLAKQNPSQLEYHRAVANFTASCAGYCVATYILGICDRHNDNIMLKTSGHLFHIDFGKFLGDAQKFGSFKRDRTPFVLTADMAYVINGGEKPSDKFQSFVDLCCSAFNIIRQNGHLLLYLFALMASSGIPGVTMDAVLYVQTALLQDMTNAEAGAHFAKFIQESLRSWFTQVNFFIHNLGQMRFTTESPEVTDNGCLLSFVPHTYTMQEDGRILSVKVHNYQKRYNPNKYYVYIIKVMRKSQREPTFLFRSYREFSEFHQKLCCIYPLAKIHSLPKGVLIGRSEVKGVAEKRKHDIILFLHTLFMLADEIAHSSLTYTFFHPLLRDQEDTDIHIKKLKMKYDNRVNNTTSIGRAQGQVKISLQYIRGQLQVLVQHARNLYQSSGDPEPSAYVKLYLVPDPNKKTKRKTKVVKKSCHPTFMEMITYRMSLDIIHQKSLYVSVWSEDVFSENGFLGSASWNLSTLRLNEEVCEWLSLENKRRSTKEIMDK